MTAELFLIGMALTFALASLVSTSGALTGVLILLALGCAAAGFVLQSRRLACARHRRRP